MAVVKVLIVDDSPIVAEGLSRILAAEGDIEIAGVAGNGEQAIQMVTDLRPDLVTMDLTMPIMGGLDAIEQIMAYEPTPILVVTGEEEGERYTFQALARGALDLVKKPNLNAASPAEHRELRRKVHLLASVPVVQHVEGRRRDRQAAQVSDRLRARSGDTKIIAIVASTGGPQALPHVLAPLPREFPLGIAIVQHITDGFTDGLARWLDSLCDLDVQIPQNGQKLGSGQVFIAPAGFHLRIDADCQAVLVRGEPVGGHLPSGDILLDSVAANFGHRAIGVILTGMQRDGALGLKAIKDAGGFTIAQDEETSVVFGMPKAAIDLGAVDKVLPIDQMAKSLAAAAGVPTAVGSSARLQALREERGASSSANHRIPTPTDLQSAIPTPPGGVNKRPGRVTPTPDALRRQSRFPTPPPDPNRRAPRDSGRQRRTPPG